jgi:hypothetical protein
LRRQNIRCLIEVYHFEYLAANDLHARFEQKRFMKGDSPTRPVIQWLRVAWTSIVMGRVVVAIRTLTVTGKVLLTRFAFSMYQYVRGPGICHVTTNLNNPYLRTTTLGTSYKYSTDVDQVPSTITRSGTYRMLQVRISSTSRNTQFSLRMPTLCDARH